MGTRPERKKMCWNCEANVSVKAESCPYCQAELYPDEEGSPKNAEQEYPSPYKPPQSNNFLSQSQAPSSPFALKVTENDLNEEEDSNDEEVLEPSQYASNGKNIVVTMGMLMSGLVFLLFGLVLLTFSSNGYLVLRWSNAYWYIYALLGALMLFFGFRSLKDIDD